jgi:hypothetical protein
LELHEDEQTTLSSFNSKYDNRYQVLAIIGDNSEEFDDNNNPVINTANMNRGATHLAEGDTGYQPKIGTQSKQPSSTAQPYQ